MATAARLAASPLSGGANPGAMLELLELVELLELELEEVEAVVVPLVVLSSTETSAVKLVSDPKAADTVEAFVQVDVSVPEPETKLTAAHCRRDNVSTTASYTLEGRRGAGTDRALTWYSSPSGASATTPKTPCWPTQLSGAATADWQYLPLPVWVTMGYSWVQLELADSSRVARNSQLAVGWVINMATGSPPTWKSDTVSEEKSTVIPPQGPVDSVSSSKVPADVGALRVKWAAARVGKRSNLGDSILIMV